MPGLVPPSTDERVLLLAFLGQQRDALRYAAHGLTDEQADARPSVSALSVAGIIKHVSQVERAWVTFLNTGDSRVFAVTDDYADGFGLVAGETLEDVLASAAEQARDTEQVVSGIDDLGSQLPPTTDVVPWIPAGLRWTPRWVLLHLIEEVARHAGHADIVRESIDNATCWTLMAAAEGWSMDEWAEEAQT
jgi:uncharacterized damage-inducible protein DinB